MKTQKYLVLPLLLCDQNDINDVIQNQVEPVLAGRGMQEFYYQNFLRPSLTLPKSKLESKYN